MVERMYPNYWGNAIKIYHMNNISYNILYTSHHNWDSIHRTSALLDATEVLINRNFDCMIIWQSWNIGHNCVQEVVSVLAWTSCKNAVFFKRKDSARPGGSCSISEDIQKRNSKHGGNRRRGGTPEELKWNSSSAKGSRKTELVNVPLWEIIQLLCNSSYNISTCFSCTCCPSCTVPCVSVHTQHILY